MAFDKKQHVVDDLAPDVAVIQEISEDAQIRSVPGVSSVWSTPGIASNKGIAVLGFGGWTIEGIDAPTNLPWVLPCRITRPDGSHWANLLAVWTHKSRGDGRPPYADQFHALSNVWADAINASQTLVAGDLNASIQGPSAEGHRESLRRADEVGLGSAYHWSQNCDHGGESDMTLKWIGPGKKTYLYHCDFIFAPKPLLTGLTSFVHPIFSIHENHVSDHQPVVADFAD